MRIAYVISTLEQCGPVNVLLGIVQSIADSCVSEVFTLAREPQNTRIQDFQLVGCKVTCVCESRAGSFVFGKKRLKAALSTFSPDIVHAHGFRAYILCKDLVYPKVATVHNYIYEDFVYEYGTLAARWMTRKEIKALKQFDEVVACSDVTADHINNEYVLSVRSIRNGVDQSVYKPVDMDAKRELRREVGYPSDKYVFVATCGCSERKNTPFLIDCFTRANRSGKAQLHIFGSGPDYDTCKELGDDSVFLHGFVNDVVPYLQCADCFISLSQCEGLPMAVLEALSCGIPAILSDIAPHREIAEMLDSDTYIRLCDVETQDAVSESLSNPMRRIDSMAVPLAFESISSRMMGNKYYRLYGQMIGASESLVRDVQALR